MQSIWSVFQYLPGVITGFTIHEFSHAWTANRLGDPTARLQGRMSLNPVRHLDKTGFLLLLLTGFGWAKPVQFTEENLGHPKRDKALIALAGPLSNIVFALLILVSVKFLLRREAVTAFLRRNLSYDAIVFTVDLVLRTAAVNLGMACFNLIPIPPLDGSRIFLSGFDFSPVTEAKITRAGGLLLLLIILAERVFDIHIINFSRFIGWLFQLVLM
ncbi:MAG: site-2 protease family protein [Fusobacteriaceae bacterium]|jgi:Zn-dependent protease|nr:site-2 protease family protein [Fusobacteriaceae bacterium]